MTIEDTSLTNGIKLTMVDSTVQQFDNIVKAEHEKLYKDPFMQECISEGTVKVHLHLIVTL